MKTDFGGMTVRRIFEEFDFASPGDPDNFERFELAGGLALDRQLALLAHYNQIQNIKTGEIFVVEIEPWPAGPVVTFAAVADVGRHDLVAIEKESTFGVNPADPRPKEHVDGDVWSRGGTDRYVVVDHYGVVLFDVTLTLEEKDRLVELWQEPGRRSVRLSEIRRKSIPESVYEEFAEALSKASGLSVGVIRGDMSAPLMRVESPTTIDLELEALIDCMRPSAQETLESLHRHGWELRRR